ncbi:unnamed protein product [Linum trigynum]|uniref:Uncharacterized protein n=1 Tax=Linum trigynum TaxID=586398 RepID=A0AAV2DDJ8_9ROSI
MYFKPTRLLFSSIIITTLLILSCLSIHATDARHFGAVVFNKNHQKENVAASSPVQAEDKSGHVIMAMEDEGAKDVGKSLLGRGNPAKKNQGRTVVHPGLDHQQLDYSLPRMRTPSHN